VICSPTSPRTRTQLATEFDDREIAAAIREVLATREPPKTACPSEVARRLDPDDWRPLMGRVRDVVRAMARRGELEVTQRGVVLEPDAAWRGAVRVRRVR
jgi:hypothetical protein